MRKGSGGLNRKGSSRTSPKAPAVPVEEAVPVQNGDSAAPSTLESAQNTAPPLPPENAAASASEQSPSVETAAPPILNGAVEPVSPTEQSPSTQGETPQDVVEATPVEQSTPPSAPGDLLSTQGDIVAALSDGNNLGCPTQCEVQEGTDAVPFIDEAATTMVSGVEEPRAEDVPVVWEVRPTSEPAESPAPVPEEHTPTSSQAAKQRRVSQASTLTLSSRRSSVSSAVARRLSTTSDGASAAKAPSVATQPQPKTSISPAAETNAQCAAANTPAEPKLPSHETLSKSAALATNGPQPARAGSDPQAPKAPIRVFTRAQNQNRRLSAGTTGSQVLPPPPPPPPPEKVVCPVPAPSTPPPVGQHLAQARQLAQLASSSNAPLLALHPPPTLGASSSPSHGRSPHRSPQRVAPASPNNIEVDTKALCSSIPQYMLSEGVVSPWHTAARQPRRQDPGSPAPYPGSPSHEMEDAEEAVDSDGRTAQYKSEFYDNGDSYMGYILDGVKHGRGVYLFANGSQYKGNWCGGTMHGWGVFIEQDTGDRFEGEWVDGERNFGIYYYSNGDMYHGGFLGNKKQGRGVVWEKRLMYEVVYNQDICIEKSLWSTTSHQSPTKARSVEDALHQREGQERLQQANQRLRARNALLTEKLARVELLLSQAESAKDRRPSTSTGASNAPFRPSSGPHPREAPAPTRRRKASDVSGHSDVRCVRSGASDEHSSCGHSGQADREPTTSTKMQVGVSPWKQESPSSNFDRNLLRAAMEEEGRSAECPSEGSSMPPSPMCNDSPLGWAPSTQLPTTPSHSRPEPFAACTTPTSDTAAQASSSHTDGHHPNGVGACSVHEMPNAAEHSTNPLHGHRLVQDRGVAPSSHPASPPPPTSQVDHTLPRRKGKAPANASHTIHSAVAPPQAARSAQSTPTDLAAVPMAPQGPRRNSELSASSRLLCPTEASLAKASTKHPAWKPRSASVEPVARPGSPSKRGLPDSPGRRSPKSPEASTGLSSSLLGCRSPSPRKAKPLEELSAYNMSAERARDVFRYYNSGPLRTSQAPVSVPPPSETGSRATSSSTNLSFGPRP
eukprot:GGOE01019650.1.p1 GENE.GGOE01019650.1~~GGOE01019650.1.p1  ORF type:complete len:1185 (+),score=158.91 GGOE01019650.1:346-3555(+)